MSATPHDNRAPDRLYIACRTCQTRGHILRWRGRRIEVMCPGCSRRVRWADRRAPWCRAVALAEGSGGEVGP